MDNSALRNRRPLTYGSARSQPHLNAEKPARSNLVKRSPKGKDLSSSSRLSRPVHAKLQRDKNGDQPSVSVELTASREFAPPSSTAESDVYDIPSSGDEQPFMARRKRRRYSPDGNKAVPASRRPDKPSEVDGDGDLSSYPGKRPSNAQGPLTEQRQIDQQISLVKSISNPKADKSVRSHIKKPALQQETKVAAKESVGRAGSRRESSPDMHQSTPKANITPGRRRLIDSLGITKIPTENLPESPSSQSSPSSILPDRASPDVAMNENDIENQIQGSPAPVPPSLRGSQVTYARQRSFLDDMISEDIVTDNIPSGPKHRTQSAQHQLNYASSFSARLIVPNEDINEDASVRSIHELRQAGGNARYRGAVESIFEDIEDTQNSLTGRCNAFLQLCGKLLDTSISGRFIECNFDKRLVDCLSMDLQLVPTILSLCAYALASSDRQMSYVLATSAWSKLLNASHTLLGLQDEITVVLKAKTSGLSRPLQKTIQNTVPQISNMLFPETHSSKLTPCTLALYCLKSTISTLQTKGTIPSLSTSFLQTLVQTLVSESRRCVSLGKTGPESAQILSMGFSILEIATASAEWLTGEHQDTLDPLCELDGLLGLGSDTASQIQSLYIRLILNITNSNPSVCDKFANLEMVGGLVHIISANFGDLTEDTLGQENNSLDIVILALGALINLTEQSEASRLIFLHSAGSTRPFLDRLLQLFMTHVDSIATAHSVLEVHHNVAVGYLAVLLLTLSLDLELRSQIKDSLAPKGLAVVVSTVDEFMQYHQKIEQEISPVSPQGKPASGSLSRLQELIARARLMEQ